MPNNRLIPIRDPRVRWGLNGPGRQTADQVLIQQEATTLTSMRVWISIVPEQDVLEFMRDPATGFVSVTLPLMGGTGLPVKVS